MGDDVDENAAPLSGSCLCGGVAYRIRGPFRSIARCHCSMCRKQSGAEHATNASADRAGFELLRGAELLRGWESSPGEFREFCGECGSSLFKRSEANPDVVRIRVGTLDDDFTTPVQSRIFTADRLSISEIPEGREPCFEGEPVA